MWLSGVRTAATWAKGGHHLPIVALLVCGAAPEAWAQLRTRVYASGFNTPVAFVQDPDLPGVFRTSRSLKEWPLGDTRSREKDAIHRRANGHELVPIAFD